MIKLQEQRIHNDRLMRSHIAENANTTYIVVIYIPTACRASTQGLMLMMISQQS